MNKASRWGMLALAVAFVGVATASLADSDLPPARYDIGGETERETLTRFESLFEAVLIRVPVNEVRDECDAIHKERTGRPYPATEGERLLGCLIQGWDYSDPVIVYPVDRKRPWLTNQILRHELGHLLGWPDDHPR